MGLENYVMPVVTSVFSLQYECLFPLIEERGVICYSLYNMNYYAIQVYTKKEESFIEQASSNIVKAGYDVRFVFPRRRLSVRRQGNEFLELYPLFPGYVFLEAERLPDDLYNVVSTTKSFCRFLPSNQNIQPLGGHDLAVLRKFSFANGIAEPSQVFFDKNDRIVVVAGPLLGLEGHIIKVDRRKRRAKINLDFASELFQIDLAFEVIKKMAGCDGGSDDSSE